jgi:hypothetical protein
MTDHVKGLLAKMLERVLRGASRAMGIEPPEDDDLLFRGDDDLVATYGRAPKKAETPTRGPSAARTPRPDAFSGPEPEAP